MYTVVIFYRFRELSKEDEERVAKEWEDLKKHFPKFGVKLVSNNVHAFGTSWNGFLVIEAEDFDDYVKFWKWFKDRIRWYISMTQTVIGIRKE